MSENKLFPILGLVLFLAAFIASLYVLSQIAIGNTELSLQWPWIITLIISAVGVLFMARDFKSNK